MDQGEIYKLTCPTGKVYIGQCVTILSNGSKYGTRGRWLSHISDSKRQNGGNCRRLNEAIRLYGDEKFTVETLLNVNTYMLDEYEAKFIALYNSTNIDCGYNLRHGGNHSRLSADTRAIMSKNRILKPNFQQPHSESTKQKLRDANIDKVIRYGHTGQILPKYVKYVNWKDRKGYCIVSHPQCKIKYFVSNQSLDDLYEQCICALALL